MHFVAPGPTANSWLIAGGASCRPKGILAELTTYQGNEFSYLNGDVVVKA